MRLGICGACVVKGFSCALYVRVSCEKLCRAGVLSACSTCHGSFIPTYFVLSARSDPIILRVDFAVMRRDACCGARGVLAVSVAFVG